MSRLREERSDRARASASAVRARCRSRTILFSIVDGIRVENSSASTTIGVGGQQPSRFNDINPEDIEKIDILKGPAAAALYGTAAANGVIQITTKHGRTGTNTVHRLWRVGQHQERYAVPEKLCVGRSYNPSCSRGHANHELQPRQPDARALHAQSRLARQFQPACPVQSIHRHGQRGADGSKRDRRQRSGELLRRAATTIGSRACSTRNRSAGRRTHEYQRPADGQLEHATRDQLPGGSPAAATG